LKLLTTNDPIVLDTSPLPQGRGLKPFRCGERPRVEMSPLPQGRGLKLFA